MTPKDRRPAMSTFRAVEAHMIDPAIRQTFDAYRAAVSAERALADAITDDARAPSKAELAEFDRLEAEIGSHKAVLDRATPPSETPDVRAAASSIEAIAGAADGALWGGQRKRWDAAARHIDAAGEQVRAYNNEGLSHAYEQLRAALGGEDRAGARTWAGELNRLLIRAEQSREVDAVRGRLGGIFEASSMTEHSEAGGPSIRALLDAYRETGQTQTADYRINPEFYETRALASSGGSAIPTTFADFVVVFERTRTPMLDPNIVTVLGRSTGAPFTIPNLTADPTAPAGTVTAEAGNITETDATLAAVTLNPFKYASIQIYSAELGEDEVVGLTPMLAKAAARQIASAFGGHATTGDGSGKPNGIVSAATNGGTASLSFGGTASTFFDYGDLVSLWGSLPAPYRSGGSWMVSNGALTKILSFRDDNGDRVLIPGLNGGPPSVLGRPLIENPDMAAVASASKSVLFGDMTSYHVARVSPMRVQISSDYKFQTDQLALKTVERIDGDLVDTAAVAYLVSGTS